MLLLQSAVWAAAGQGSGSALLEHAAALYGRMHSCTCRMRVALRATGSPLLTGMLTLRMQRPNLLFLQVSLPKSSSERIIACNGHSFIVYAPGANRYTIEKAPANMMGLLPLLQKAGIQSALDPLYFFCGGRLPAALAIKPSIGNAVLHGQACSVVSATAYPPKGGKSPAHTKRAVVYWKWCINRKTGLLLQVKGASGTVQVRGNIALKGKKFVWKRKPARLRFEQDIFAMQINPALNSSNFTIHMRPGARRMGAALK